MQFVSPMRMPCPQQSTTMAPALDPHLLRHGGAALGSRLRHQESITDVLTYTDARANLKSVMDRVLGDCESAAVRSPP